MLKWAFVFLLISIVSGALGYSGVAAASGGIAKTLFFIFFGVFVVLLILGLTVVNKVRVRLSQGDGKAIR